MVGVAQLVERRVVVADVAGSSPVTHPNLARCFRKWICANSGDYGFGDHLDGVLRNAFR
jgi:hypothetical protein